MAAQPTRGPGTTPYRGEDRRRIAGPVEPPVGRPFLMAALLIALLFLGALRLDLSSAWLAEAHELMQTLQVASFMVAVGVGVLAISRWYLTSDAPALWIGVALLIYGVFRLAAAELVPHVVTAEPLEAWLSWVRPASQLTVVMLLIWGARIFPVSTSVSGPRVVLGGLGTLALLVVLLRLLPPLASMIDGAGQTLPRAYTSVNQIGVIPFAFGVLGVSFSWQGYRRRRWLFAWLGLCLLCIALGDVARVVSPPPLESGLLGEEILRLVGLLLALNGGTREILYTYRDNSTRLAQSEYTAMTAQERIREGQAIAEERAHEARSALAAIEGATRTLEHYRDRLPPETRAALSTAVSGEIRRLQALVSVDEDLGEIAPFSLAESLAPIVASERGRGVEVDVRVPGDLDVLGRAAATEQVLQTLFDNARRYAPGTPVLVRAERNDGWVVVRVDDRGPGVTADQREAIFRRGVRGDAALDVPGSGLGLYVAAKLMQQQDGELWVDERPGGGASFALALPAAEESDEQPVHRLDDVSQTTQDNRIRLGRRGD